MVRLNSTSVISLAISRRTPASSALNPETVLKNDDDVLKCVSDCEIAACHLGRPGVIVNESHLMK